MSADDPLMDYTATGLYLGGRSERYVRRLTKLGATNPEHLPTIRLGSRVFIRRSDANAWIDRNAA